MITFFHRLAITEEIWKGTQSFFTNTNHVTDWTLKTCSIFSYATTIPDQLLYSNKLWTTKRRVNRFTMDIHTRRVPNPSYSHVQTNKYRKSTIHSHVMQCFNWSQLECSVAWWLVINEKAGRRPIHPTILYNLLKIP